VVEKLLPRLLGALEERVPAKKKPEYLTPREAAKASHKSPTTIYDAIHSGELRYLAHGSRYLVRREDLDDWMERRVNQ
jgi:excisionase family DNA binding protein